MLRNNRTFDILWGISSGKTAFCIRFISPEVFFREMIRIFQIQKFIFVA